MDTGTVIAASLQQGLINLGVIAASLTALAAMFTKVPPFRQIGRFLWRHLVSEPLKGWFHGELHEGICPIVKDSISEAVPPAVAAAVVATVEPAIEVIRTEFRDHMAIEKGDREALDVALTGHWKDEDDHWERQTAHNAATIAALKTIDERHTETTEILTGIDKRLDRVETKIDVPIPPMEAVVTLHQVPPPDEPTPEDASR